MNSLHINCKNHYYKENLDSNRWAFYREIFGPTKLVQRKMRTNAFIPFHKKVYQRGCAYRTGAYIIPNVNLESYICKKWAHCSIIILSENASYSENGKIIIDNHKLKLCFFVKIRISFQILMTPVGNETEINEKVNEILGTNFDQQSVNLFLETNGNILSYIYDEMTDLGLNLNLRGPINRKRAGINIVNFQISDFFEPENSPMFSELINLSCIGSAHMENENL